MSKLYKNYVLLKINCPEKIYAFKCGIFCIFLDEDAKLMSKVLNLKLGNLNHDIVKCGFPYNSIDKYMNILHNLNYNVEIVDSKTNSIFNYNTYVINDKIKNFLTKASQLEIDKLSISQTYGVLSDIKSEAIEILKGI